MLPSVLVTLREGLEAALIIGILLGFVSKTKLFHLKKPILLGIGLGILASILTALFFSYIAGGFEGKNEEVFEGVIMLMATGIITYMIIWMQKQSSNENNHIEEKLLNATSNQNVWSIFSLSFLAIYREGVEIVLFIGAIISTSTVLASLVGAVIGLIGAIILSYLLFKTTVRLPIQSFFKTTGVLLIFIAAGLFAHGIHELQEAHVFPTMIEHLYDVNDILNEKGTFGSLFKAMFGYNGNPSLVEVLGYWIYIIIFALIFFIGTNRRINIHQK